MRRHIHIVGLELYQDIDISTPPPVYYIGVISVHSIIGISTSPAHSILADNEHVSLSLHH